jgi:predicted phage terminase large subunit-like protein
MNDVQSFTSLGAAQQASEPLQGLSYEEKVRFLALLEEKERLEQIKSARSDFLAFCHHVYPGFKEGPHHRIIAKLLKEVLDGAKTRVIINIAPRFGKSETVSYLFAAFFYGIFPEKKVIMTTHTASLSENYGRRVRNLIRSEEYQEIFPNTRVSADQQAAGQWSTTAGGQYYAAGVGGALAGRGADLLITDDPHSEQDVKTQGKAVFEKAWTWYQTGPLQRLMPGGAVIVIMTRWDELDLTGRLLDFSVHNPDADEWDLIELPPILPSGRSLWPAQWPIEELVKKKNSMQQRFWDAQYMQDPCADEGAMIKREWWRVWEREEMPRCEFVIMALDGAFTTTSVSNFSAITVFGVFYSGEDNKPGVILLDTFNERVEFPELKGAAFKFYKAWKPEAFIVEAKASGLPLLQELRRMGIPAQEFVPSRASSMMLSNDKIARVAGITDIFSSGMVWAPETRWAGEVVEQCAKFPNGAHDDLVDCVTMSLVRFRQGGFVKLPSDFDDSKLERPRRGAYAI